MDRELKHDVVILGAGLAGLRAAVEISRRLEGQVDIGIVSKVQLMRAHSVCAEGGTAAVLRPDQGDSLRAARLGHGQGLRLPGRPGRGATASSRPSRRRSASSTTGASPGRATRRAASTSARSAGTRYPRATLAADKTGFFEMQTLYDTLLRYRSFTRYDEFFVTDILVEDGRFAGLVGLRHRHAARPWRSAARRC